MKEVNEVTDTMTEKQQPCVAHVWYNLPGNYTRECERCQLEENL